MTMRISDAARRRFVLDGIAVTCALAALAGPVLAQQPDPAAAAESVERVAALDWLVGTWEGSGWMLLPTGERHSFTSWEQVESRLGGRILLVEGVHHAEMPGVDTAVVVHHAMGAITWDANADRYVFHTWLGLRGGGGADNEFEVTEDGFRWLPNTGPGGPHVVFTARHVAGEWVEIGEVRLPDGRVIQSFEMRLRKVE